MDPIEHNRQAWDQRARERQRFTRPAKDEALKDPMPIVDPRGWLGGNITGKRVLCLASGGGRHGPLYAAAGASVTVNDVSDQQLETDRRMAVEKKMDIRTVCASMDDLPLPAMSFDIVIHPVSTCYVPDIVPVYREVARVLRPDGLYISQHKTPTSMQADVRRSPRGYELITPYYRKKTEALPEVIGSLHREPGTVEYLHRWEELIGGLCRNGFVVEDLSEPYHGDRSKKPGSWGDRSEWVAPYVRIKARRVRMARARGRGSPTGCGRASAVGLRCGSRFVSPWGSAPISRCRTSRRWFWPRDWW